MSRCSTRGTLGLDHAKGEKESFTSTFSINLDFPNHGRKYTTSLQNYRRV